MSYKVSAAASELPGEFRTPNWEWAFVENDSRLPRYLIDDPGTCAVMA
jgi:hypothetical protein